MFLKKKENTPYEGARAVPKTLVDLYLFRRRVILFVADTDKWSGISVFDVVARAADVFQRCDTQCRIRMVGWGDGWIAPLGDVRPAN